MRLWSLKISEICEDLRSGSNTPFQPCPEAGGGGSMGYRLFRRPQISFVCVTVFVSLGLCECGIVGVVSLWVVIVLLVGVCVCVFTCLCLFACCVLLSDHV